MLSETATRIATLGRLVGQALSLRVLRAAEDRGDFEPWRVVTPNRISSSGRDSPDRFRLDQHPWPVLAGPCRTALNCNRNGNPGGDPGCGLSAASGSRWGTAVRFLPAAAGNPPKCEITRQSGSLGAQAVPAADQGSGCGQQLGRALQATAAHGQGRPGRCGDARDHRRVPFAGDGRSCQPVPGRAQRAGWPGCLLWSGGLCPSCSGGGNHGRRCLCCAGCDCLHLVYVLGLQGKGPSQWNQEGCEPLSHSSATRLTATSDRPVPELA